MEAHLKSDSQLLVRQLNGEYKVRDMELRPAQEEGGRALLRIKVHFEHIPREHNTEADSLSKEGAEIGKKRKTR